MLEKIPTLSHEREKVTAEKTAEDTVVKELNLISLEIRTAISDIESNHGEQAIELLRNAESQLQNARREVEELTHKLQEAQQDARIDHLTGLANKRAFDEVIKSAMKSGLRSLHNNPESNVFNVISFDLDGFKEINDTYGHAIGDLYLKRITEKVKDSFARGTDTLARIGGDEFSLLINDKNNVRANAERIHAAVLDGAQQARRELETEKGTIPDDSGIVSASIGYTAFDPKNDKNAKDVTTRADYAVYVVKASGKDGILSDVDAEKDFDVEKTLYAKFLAKSQSE